MELFPVREMSVRRSQLEQAVTDIVAGTLGGMATVIIGHPLDTVKVRLQTSNTYSSTTSCIRSTWLHEGYRGFYKGIQSPLAGEAFFNAVQFFAYGQSKHWIINSRSEFPSISQYELTVPDYYVAGGVTGAASCFVECPVDLVKSQLQTVIHKPNPEYRTFFECVRAIVSQRGIVGLYQGLGSTFGRTIPSSAAYFGMYEHTREYFRQPGTSRDSLPVHYVLLAGAVGGIAYWLPTFPLDSIKSAMQSDEIRPEKRRYKGFVDCCAKLYHEGGVRRFYRGLTPCLLRAVPSNMACFGVYEWVKAVIER